MKKQTIVVGIFLMLLIVGFSGCTETNDTEITEEDFFGSWSGSDGEILTFYNNDSIHSFETISIIDNTTNNTIYNNVSLWGYWDFVSNEQVFIEFGGFSHFYDYVFSDNNNILTMTYNQLTVVYTKE